jgi:hypothetical protein
MSRLEPVPLRPDRNAMSALVVRSLVRAAIVEGERVRDKTLQVGEILRRRGWEGDDAAAWLVRAASSPAKTTVAGWASELAGTTQALLLALGPVSADAALLNGGLQLNRHSVRRSSLTNSLSCFKAYDVTKVIGDHYGGEFVKEPFRKHGISYELCKQPKSDLYRDLSPSLNSGQIVLPRHDRLVAQICGLERRTGRARTCASTSGPAALGCGRLRIASTDAPQERESSALGGLPPCGCDMVAS